MSEIFSCLLGVLLGVFLVLMAWLSPILEECEQSLPRTEHCELIAVPERSKV